MAEISAGERALLEEVAELREFARGVQAFGRPVSATTTLTNYVIPASVWMHAERIVTRMDADACQAMLTGPHPGRISPRRCLAPRYSRQHDPDGNFWAKHEFKALDITTEEITP